MEHLKSIKKLLEINPNISNAETVSFTLGYLHGVKQVANNSSIDGGSYLEMTQSKIKFAKFVKSAAASTDSREYKELYKFLLKCFTDADADFSGMINAEEFKTMIDIAAAAPRKFGFAPSNDELYSDKKVLEDARMKMFKAMDAGGKGMIAFDVWLHLCYDHIRAKASTLEVPAVDNISRDKESFIEFVKNASSSRHSSAYKELYHFLLDCFAKADVNHDGQIGPYEFDKLIEEAAAAPRKFGLAPMESQMYNNHKERIKARTEMFKAMDIHNTGNIAFDEWLSFTYNHIREKVSELEGWRVV